MQPRPKSKKPEPTPAARALRLLARRDYTRLELAKKLAPHIEDRAELEAVLDDVAARGWLSESRVVEQVLAAKGARMGPARIRQTLLQRGVPEALIGPALARAKAAELETAQNLWARKFGAARAGAVEEARQVRFLQSRGFSLDVALRVVRRRGALAMD